MQKLLKSKLKDKKGFTLVEILVVLAIMAILIAIAVPVMVGALNDAKEKVVLADARAAYIAFEMQRAEKTDVTLNDVKSYIDKTDDDTVKIGVEYKTADDKTSAVTKFYYRDDRLDDGRYVVITMGGKGSIEDATIPAGAEITNTTTNPTT